MRVPHYTVGGELRRRFKTTITVVAMCATSGDVSAVTQREDIRMGSQQRLYNLWSWKTRVHRSNQSGMLCRAVSATVLIYYSQILRDQSQAKDDEAVIRKEQKSTHARAHARTHARTHAHTHTHTHTLLTHCDPLSIRKYGCMRYDYCVRQTTVGV